MTPAGRFAAIIEILCDLNAKAQTPAEQIVQNYCRARRYMGSKDRRFVKDSLYGILRRRARLTWHLSFSSQSVKPRHEQGNDEQRAGQALFDSPRLAVALYGLLAGAIENLEALKAIYSGQGYAPDPLTRDEEEQLSKLLEQGVELDDKGQPPAVQAEIPAWLWPVFAASFANEEQALAEAKALQQAAPVVLRVNSLKVSRDQVVDALQKDGFPCQPGSQSADSIFLAGRQAIAGHAVYKQGWVELQDESSQLFCRGAQVKAGMHILDFCAGAGGKSLALASLMENRGRLVASDIDPQRLKRLRPRQERAGAYIIEPVSFDDLITKKIWQGAFDRVVLDAPCSGSGTWRRQPDGPWRLSPARFDQYLTAQQDCLEKASPLVKPGGWLCYATCSLLREENEAQIEAFLKKHPEFSVVKGKDFIRLSPLKNRSDGFFGAFLCRN